LLWKVWWLALNAQFPSFFFLFENAKKKREEKAPPYLLPDWFIRRKLGFGENSITP